MDQLVSICIPTYKQAEFLEICLQSVAFQSHRSLEVCITDDTPDDSIKKIVDKFTDRFPVRYNKNKKQLGSPRNWNEALAIAKGSYILLMHHDDSFADNNSLRRFLQPFKDDSAVDFVFGHNPSLRLRSRRPFHSFFRKYYDFPELLLTGNYIGAPSNVMLKASVVEHYNPLYKWIVDIEFYIRLFKKKKKLFYVDETLVNIGIHEGQISNSCVNNPDVLVFEYVSYATENNLRWRSVRIYDFYWRLLRNAKITSLSQLSKLGIWLERVPAFIRLIINDQRELPIIVLKTGIGSKAAMFLSWLKGRRSIRE